MFEITCRYTAPYPTPNGDNYEQDRFFTSRYQKASRLFREAMRKGALYRFKAKISNRPPGLLELEDLKSIMKVGNARYTGMNEIPIWKIIGTEGRSEDFDRLFHPVHERLQPRWINIAFAWLSFEPLPAVELIQIGNAYFVRDGHHRISVARAMGVKDIDAEVTVWEAGWISPETLVTCAEILATAG